MQHKKKGELSLGIIFIFSLPRSGSTLLQRMLMASEDICTVVEPWIMLPLVYSYYDKIPHSVDLAAIHGNRFVNFFIENNLEGGYGTYRNELKKMAMNLYRGACRKSCKKGNVKYFLDKTPRYYLIIPELAKIFPEAKFIFLFRNPLAVVASIVDRWLGGRLMLRSYGMDIFDGPKYLAEGYRKVKQRSLSVKYEDLVKNPKAELEKIAQYLGISLDSEKVLDFVRNSRIPKDVNSRQYCGVPLIDLSNKWKNIMNTPIRKLFLKRYINYLGSETLSEMGYKKDELLREIGLIEVTDLKLFGDLKDVMFDIAKYYMPRGVKLKIKNLLSKTDIMPQGSKDGQEK